MYPNLKLQIFRLGTHQNHIARALRMDESVLSKIIHGYRQPSQEQRRQLADFLKVEENWLFEKYEATRLSPAPTSAGPEAEQKDGLS